MAIYLGENKVDGSGSGGSGTFIAEYNVTTLSAIDTAYNNGDTIICHYSTTVIIDPSDPSTTTTINYYVPLISRLEQTGYQQYNFCVFGDAYGSTRIGITVDNTNGWTLYT